jgi:hypothetical protein
MTDRASPTAMPPKKPVHPRPFARRDKPIPKSPEDIAHSERANRILAALAEIDIHPSKPGVYPTVDRTGFVRLTFDEVDQLTGVDTRQ